MTSEKLRVRMTWVPIADTSLERLRESASVYQFVQASLKGSYSYPRILSLPGERTDPLCRQLRRIQRQRRPGHRRKPRGQDQLRAPEEHRDLQERRELCRERPLEGRRRHGGGGPNLPPRAEEENQRGGEGRYEKAILQAEKKNTVKVCVA